MKNVYNNIFRIEKKRGKKKIKKNIVKTTDQEVNKLFAQYIYFIFIAYFEF